MDRIGFCGPMGSGKDLAAKILQQYIPAQIRPFAGPLKKVCSELSGLPLHYFYENKGRKVSDVIFGPASFKAITSAFGVPAKQDVYDRIGLTVFSTPRKMLQIVGTNILRAIDVDCHINLWKNWGTGGCYVPDVRFENEYHVLDYLVYVERNSATQFIGTHESESNYEFLKSKADLILDNNGTIAELDEQIRQNLV